MDNFEYYCRSKLFKTSYKKKIKILGKHLQNYERKSENKMAWTIKYIKENLKISHKWNLYVNPSIELPKLLR